MTGREYSGDKTGWGAVRVSDFKWDMKERLAAEVVSKQGLPVLMCQVCGRCVLAGRTKVKAVTLDHLQVWAEELRPALLG